MKLKTYIFLSFLTLASFACDKDSDPIDPTIEEQQLVSYTLMQEYPLANLQLLVSLIPDNPYANSLRYSVSIYKVVYKTTYKNEVIEASGVLYLPQNLAEPGPLLSLQHGTAFRKNDAPSANTDFNGFELFAAAGYITFMPDYIGYGASADKVHPYYDQEHSALAVIDLLKAGKEILDAENVEASGQVFLAGYSEGGYVTMAAAREIEEEPAHGLTLTAIAAGAGGYDLVHMLEGVKTNSFYSYPAYFAFLLNGYRVTYDWDKPLSYFFQEPYASQIPTLLDGTQGGSYINSNLTTDLNALFDPGFYNRLKSNEEAQLQQALMSNSFRDYSPQVPTRLYHGTADTTVPLENSQNTFDRFIENGSESVELIVIPNGTHSSSLLPMIQSLFPWFEDLRNDNA